MNDPQVIDAILALAAWCEQQGIAFIHLAEADWDDAPAVPQHFRDTLRATFSGTLIVAGNYDQQKGGTYPHRRFRRPGGFRPAVYC